MRAYQNISFVFLLLLSLAFNSCLDSETEAERSCYYLQNKSYLDIDEVKFLKQHAIHKLYAKIVDIDWSDAYGAIPVSENNLNIMKESANIYDALHLNIVPVVSITNKTFLSADSTNLHLVAMRIIKKCMQTHDSADVRSGSNQLAFYAKAHFPTEIQFDCDWTESTSKSYFRFLEEVKKLMPDSIIVSATIRLHQYKYTAEMGVPPVDRGMLMLYNTSDPGKYETANSIFNYEKASAYFTTNKKYAIPLDVVLPAFSRSLVFRDHQLYQVVNEVPESQLSEPGFLQQESNGFFTVKKDTVFNNILLRAGDEIKPEAMSINDLNKAAELAHKAINSKNYSLAFLGISKDSVNKSDNNEIEKIYRSF